MKKVTIVVLAALLFLGCGTLPTRSSDERSGKGKKTEIQGDWYYYSEGLYYKARGDYKTAIKNFFNALSYSTETDSVYYQLAECYLYLLDYNSAVNYARLSIKSNRDNPKPYILIYNAHINLKNYNEAAAILEELLLVKPDNVNIHYTLGNLYYNQARDYDKAMASFQTILSLAESEPVENFYREYSHYYLGYIFYGRNQIEQSIGHFKKTIELNAENYSAVYILALVLMNNYELDEAQKYIQLYLNRFPDNIKMNSLLGRVYYLRGDIKGLPYLRLAMSSGTMDGMLAKALYLEQMKQDGEAEKLLGKIIRDYPGLISPHVGLARVSLRKGDKKGALSEYFTSGILFYKARLFNEAEQHLLKALAINDKIPEVYFYLGKVYEENNKISQAILCYKKTNELKPNAEFLIHIGYLYSLKKDFEESKRYFDMSIEMDPKNSKPYFFQGLVYSKKNRYAAAERLFRKAIELQETNDTYHYYLATVLDKQKRFNETVDSLKRAIRYNEKNALAYNYLGYLYADRNIRLEESISLIQKALDIDPVNGAYLDSLGWAYYRKGRYKQALEKLLEAERQLAKDSSPDAVVYDHIGDTYRQMGEVKKAYDYWGKSYRIEKDPQVGKKIREYQKSLKKKE